jgi:hypothetical protein
VITSAEGWVAVYGTDPDKQTSREVACWQEIDGSVIGLVAHESVGGLLLAAAAVPGFHHYLYSPH